jgi:hypothetical protein
MWQLRQSAESETPTDSDLDFNLVFVDQRSSRNGKAYVPVEWTICGWVSPGGSPIELDSRINSTIALREACPMAKPVRHEQGFHSITNSVGRLWSPFTTKKRKASFNCCAKASFSVDFSSAVPGDCFWGLIHRQPFPPFPTPLINLLRSHGLDNHLSRVSSQQGRDSRFKKLRVRPLHQKATCCKEPKRMGERGVNDFDWVPQNVVWGLQIRSGNSGYLVLMWSRPQESDFKEVAYERINERCKYKLGQKATK